MSKAKKGSVFATTRLHSSDSFHRPRRPTSCAITSGIEQAPHCVHFRRIELSTCTADGAPTPKGSSRLESPMQGEVEWLSPRFAHTSLRCRLLGTANTKGACLRLRPLLQCLDQATSQIHLVAFWRALPWPLILRPCALLAGSNLGPCSDQTGAEPEWLPIDTG